MILPISASQVVRITGVSHQHLAKNGTIMISEKIIVLNIFKNLSSVQILLGFGCR
jgi:hypothetical protein